MFFFSYFSNFSQGDSLALRHGDKICIADTEMSVHIHPGSDTCDDCEPGVAKALLAKAALEEEGEFISTT